MVRKTFSQVSIFIAALLLLGSGGVRQKLTMETLFEDFDYEVSFYSLNSLNEERIDVVNAGNFYITTCDKLMEKETEIKFSNVIGKSYKFNSLYFNLQEFIKKNNFKLEITQNLEGVKIFYLYSNSLCAQKKVNGKMINLQLAVTKEFVVAGCPVILGTF